MESAHKLGRSSALAQLGLWLAAVVRRTRADTPTENNHTKFFLKFFIYFPTSSIRILEIFKKALFGGTR